MTNAGKYDLIEAGYSAEIVCSPDEPECRNKSCQFYDNSYRDYCSDVLNCQPCPRSKLK